MKVCVIGAGASGLVAIKELQEVDHTVKCFETRHTIGGVYTELNDSAVYDSTHLTNSNYFVAFSSFPPKEGERKKHWHYTEYVDYLEAFCKEFGLREAIQFGKRVKRVARSGQSFRVETLCDGVASTELFDAVAVCSGNVRVANVPEFQGAAEFKGQIVHSESYRNAAQFAGKRVVCVGIGETGADVLHEVSTVAAHCVLSLRHYPFIVSRFPKNEQQYPTDSYSSRALHLHRKALFDLMYFEESQPNLLSTVAHQRLSAEWALKGVSPRSQFPTKSDVFIPDVAQGKVQVNVSGISHLTADSVVFKDGFGVQADVVLCCTGYRLDLSFMADVDITDVRRQLYKHTINPELGARVAFIGLVRLDVGGIPVAAELQSRYFALLCSGQRSLPDHEALAETIFSDALFDEEFFCITPLPALLHYSRFMDDLADVVGCQPRITTLIRSPTLLYNYWFGSQVACHYRLDGPGSNRKSAEKEIRRLGVAYQYSDLLMIFRWQAILWIFHILGVNREHCNDSALRAKPYMKTRFWSVVLLILWMAAGLLSLGFVAHCFGVSAYWMATVVLGLAFYGLHDMIDVATKEKNQLERARREGERMRECRKPMRLGNRGFR